MEHMSTQVYREPLLFYISGPSQEDCRKNIQSATGDKTRHACKEAVRGLLWVLSCLKAIMQEWKPRDDKAIKDTGHLFRLIAYYILVPLGECKEYWKHHSGEKEGMEYNANFQYLWNEFSRIKDWCINDWKDVPIADYLRMRNIYGILTCSVTSQIGLLSSLGTVELLLRIATDTKDGFSTIDSFVSQRLKHRAFTSTRFAPIPDPSERDKISPVFRWGALPKVAFICRGNNQVATQNTFVVATSVDRWDGFPLMETFHQNKRLSRTAYKPFTRDKEQIDQWSNSIYEKVNQYPYDVNGIINERLKTDELFHHEWEKAVAVWCPNFSVAPRCIRCQALFQYNMSSLGGTITAIEETSRRPGFAKAYRELHCAETFAHFFCRTVHPILE